MPIKPYLMRLLNFWPPFFFTGIKLIKRNRDFSELVVRLKLRFWNANFVGTQYGGSIYSMVDPFYMLMLIHHLGKDYVVWDKAASIRFLKPGRTALTAQFQLTEEDLSAIRQTVAEQGRIEWKRTIAIKDSEGAVVAEVDKVISIKRKTKDS